MSEHYWRGRSGSDWGKPEKPGFERTQWEYGAADRRRDQERAAEESRNREQRIREYNDWLGDLGKNSRDHQPVSTDSSGGLFFVGLIVVLIIAALKDAIVHFFKWLAETIYIGTILSVAGLIVSIACILLGHAIYYRSFKNAGKHFLWVGVMRRRLFKKMKTGKTNAPTTDEVTEPKVSNWSKYLLVTIVALIYIFTFYMNYVYGYY